MNQYRKYDIKVAFAAILLVTISACSSISTKKGESELDSDNFRSPAAANETAREPASMKGNFAWLNEVQSDFDRIAAETSSRSVAGSARTRILVQRKQWSFRFKEQTNRFLLKLNDQFFNLVQLSMEDDESYSFVADGQQENPITLSIYRKGGRRVANLGNVCVVELNFWDDMGKTYRKDTASIFGGRCSKVLSQLRSYVP